MRTEYLIRSLSQDVRRVPRHAVGRRIAIGIGAGALVTMALVVAVLGFRSDLASAMHGFSFWMKWAYTISLGVISVAATLHLSRPDAPRVRWLWLLVVPVLVIAVIAVGEMAVTPVHDWLAMWLGSSWKACSLLVTALSAPIFVGLLWAFRALAPADLRAAGAAAGLASGAVAASIYALSCGEVSALFVLTWYSLGMALAGAIGALLGPRVLRW